MRKMADAIFFERQSRSILIELLSGWIFRSWLATGGRAHAVVEKTEIIEGKKTLRKTKFLTNFDTAFFPPMRVKQHGERRRLIFGLLICPQNFRHFQSQNH